MPYQGADWLDPPTVRLRVILVLLEVDISRSVTPVNTVRLLSSNPLLMTSAQGFVLLEVNYRAIPWGMQLPFVGSYGIPHGLLRIDDRVYVGTLCEYPVSTPCNPHGV